MARNNHVVVTEFLCLSNVFLADLRNGSALELGRVFSIAMFTALQKFSTRILLIGRISLWGYW